MLFHILEDGAVHDIEARAGGEEEITTPAGLFTARIFLLQPLGDQTGVLKGRASVWVSQTPPGMPVRIELPLEFGTIRVDLARISSPGN